MDGAGAAPRHIMGVLPTGIVDPSVPAARSPPEAPGTIIAVLAVGISCFPRRTIDTLGRALSRQSGRGGDQGERHGRAWNFELSLKSSASQSSDTPPRRCRRHRAACRRCGESGPLILLSPIGFNRMCQENAGAEKCNKRGGQLEHGKLPYAEMRAVTAALLKALRFRMVSSPRKNGFVAAIPRLSYFWRVCVAARTHGRDTWVKFNSHRTHAQVAPQRSASKQSPSGLREFN
jgi:hypothetical protein